LAVPLIRGRVSHLLGSLESGIPDLAERHREYLLATLTRD